MNKCHFLGKLISNPELSSYHSADLVNFALEVEEYRKDKSGNKKRRTDILDFEAWDSAAKTIHKYASKNNLLAVEAIARNYNNGIVFRVTNFKILPNE